MKENKTIFNCCHVYSSCTYNIFLFRTDPFDISNALNSEAPLAIGYENSCCACKIEEIFYFPKVCDVYQFFKSLLSFEKMQIILRLHEINQFSVKFPGWSQGRRYFVQNRMHRSSIQNVSSTQKSNSYGKPTEWILTALNC